MTLDDCAFLDDNDDNEEDLGCHELMLDYAGFLKSARFWVHGVAVCVVCVLGLVGNVLTFAALGQNVGGGGGGGYVVSYCIYRSILL